MGAVAAMVVGVGTLLLGILMLADYRQFGSEAVDNFAPKWTQVGSPDTHRKFLGTARPRFRNHPLGHWFDRRKLGPTEVPQYAGKRSLKSWSGKSEPLIPGEIDANEPGLDERPVLRNPVRDKHAQ